MTGRVVAALANETFSLGPIFAGVVLRKVFVTVLPGTGGNAQLGLVIADGPVGVVAEFNGGRSLVQGPETFQPGIFHAMLDVRASAGTSSLLVLPVYVPVRQGSVYLGVYFQTTSVCSIVVGVEVEPERVVRPFLDRGRAARLNGGGGLVMDQLRGAAEAARV